MSRREYSGDLELRFARGPMAHVKAMLVDGDELLLGSANFDYLSASLQPEVMVVVRDRVVVDDFARRVLGPDLAASRRWDRDGLDPVAERIGTGAMKAARAVLTGLHER